MLQIQKITLNWTYPADKDFGHVEICCTTNNGSSDSEKSAFETTTEANKTFSGIDSDRAYYAF